MKKRGLPGVQDNILPPELTVRPTEVVEMGDPEVQVFEPNAIGSMGNSVIPSMDLWRSGLDPYQRLGGDPMTTSMRASQALINKLKYNHRMNQASDTHILEREGGSGVTYHEPTLDDQVSNVGGIEITNGVEELEQLAANLHTERHQRSPVTIRESRKLVSRLAQQMASSYRSSFSDVLRRIGREGVDSISVEPMPGTSDRVSVATESGLVASSDMGEAPLYELMRNKATQQAGNAYRPAAQYHPSQSGYASPDGQFGAIPTAGKNGRLAQMPTIASFFQNTFGKSYLPEVQKPIYLPPRKAVETTRKRVTFLDRLRRLGRPRPPHLRGLGLLPGEIEPMHDIELFRTYLDPRDAASLATKTPTTTPPSNGGDAPVMLPGGGSLFPSGGGGTPGSGENTYDTFMIGAPAPSLFGAGTGAGPEVDPDKNYWYQIIGDQSKTQPYLVNFQDLPKRAKSSGPLLGGDYAKYTLVRGQTLVKRFFLIDKLTGDVFVWAALNDLSRIESKLSSVALEDKKGPPPPGTGSEDTVSTVGEDGVVVYADDPSMKDFQIQPVIKAETNWLAVGGIALGAAAIIGVAIVATRK
jgi:hypothetical protein